VTRAWPARPLVCVECRTMLGERGVAHRALSLREPAQREQLLTAVWGPAERRQALRRAATAGACSGGFSLLDGCDLGVVDFDLGWMLAAVVVFLAVAILWLTGAALVAYVRRRRQLSTHNAHGAPHACTCRPAVTNGRTSVIGRVCADSAIAAEPWTGRPCVAYAAALTDGSSRRLFLRDGATIGFELQLPSGERVRVPAGPCELDLRDAARQRPDRAAVQAMLTELDPARAHLDDLDPFPHDQLALRTIGPGDEVELFGGVTPTIDRAAAEHGYRDAPPVILVPEGTIRLRLARARPIPHARRA